MTMGPLPAHSMRDFGFFGFFSACQHFHASPLLRLGFFGACQGFHAKLLLLLHIYTHASMVLLDSETGLSYFLTFAGGP